MLFLQEELLPDFSQGHPSEGSDERTATSYASQHVSFHKETPNNWSQRKRPCLAHPRPTPKKQPANSARSTHGKRIARGLADCDWKDLRNGCTEAQKLRQCSDSGSRLRLERHCLSPSLEMMRAVQSFHWTPFRTSDT